MRHDSSLVIKKLSLLTTSKRASEVQRGVVERVAPHTGRASVCARFTVLRLRKHLASRCHYSRPLQHLRLRELFRYQLQMSQVRLLLRA